MISNGGSQYADGFLEEKIEWMNENNKQNW